MYSILGTTSLTPTILTTTMCLVEPTADARPLSPVGDDPSYLEALTPKHFLLGPRVLAQPLLPDASSCVDCCKMYKISQSYKEKVWQRCIEEYHPQCNVRAKWNGTAKQYLEVGNLVLGNRWIRKEVLLQFGSSDGSLSR